MSDDGTTADTPHEGYLERVVVTTADGRTFDLGPPSSPLYRLRLAAYKAKRRREIKENDDG